VAVRVNDPWRAHLVRPYGEDRLEAWVRSLQWFRLVRAEPSPFAVAADELVVLLASADRDVMGRLADYPVSTAVLGGRLQVMVAGGAHRPGLVTDREVELARRIEDEVLAPLAPEVIDPPVDGRGCVWPGAYPELFT